MDYKDIANRLRKWANGETCEDCPAKDDLAFCAADAIYDLLSRVEAIRPVSREQVEKVWRGNWKKDSSVQVLAPGGQKYHFRCSKCGYSTRLHNLNFCSVCGAPMTDEAVEMVMERLEALYGQENT